MPKGNYQTSFSKAASVGKKKMKIAPKAATAGAYAGKGKQQGGK